MLFFIQALWYFLPAALANMAPVLVRKSVKILNVPVDFGKKFRGQPIFGEHKTWRGIVFGSLAGIFLISLQAVLYFNFEVFRKMSLLAFEKENFVLIGFLLGLGALIGDLIKSFFKRRVNVKPGARFFPWDQIDFVLGGMALSSIVYRPDWKVYLIIVLIIPFFHILFNHIGYWIGIQKNKW